MQLYDGTRQYGGLDITFPFDTWSVERIEVLRGPASVIYGDGAIGGVVNIISKKPSPRTPIQHEVQTSIGTNKTQRLGFGSGGAVSERLSYRLDMSGNRSNGWVDRGDHDNATFSGALQFDASRDLSLKLSHAYGDQRPMRYYGTPLIEGEQRAALRRKNYNVQDSLMRFRDHWTELAATWTPDDATRVRAHLHHINSTRDWRNAEYYDYNPATRLIDRSGNTQIAHDQAQTGLRTDATFQGAFLGLEHTLSIGVDANHSKFRHSNNTYTGSSGSVDMYDPAPGRFQSAAPFIPRYRNVAEHAALWMENRIVLMPQWSMVGGLRYDHARVQRADLVTGQRDFTRHFSDVGWRLGSVYALIPDLALYVQHSRATDPVSGLLFLSPANADFDMTQGRQTEVGIKHSFDRGEWTLAVYHLRKTNLVTRDPVDPSVSVQVGAQSSRGIEATLALDIAPGWQVEANGTLLRARYDDFFESVGGMAVARNGKVPTDIPQRLANLWLNWNFHANWSASTGLRYVGKRYADNANTLELPPYVTTDMALRWDAGPATSITLHGNNIFDKAYFTGTYYNPTQWLYGSGRQFELTLHHRF